MPLGDIGKNVAIDNSDKYVHFTFYLVFVLVWYQFAENQNRFTYLKRHVILFAIGYGVVMEICQGAFTTTRCADINDVFANSFGAIVGYLIITLLKK